MKKSSFVWVIGILFVLSLIDGLITIELIKSHGGDITIETNPLLLWIMEETKTMYSIVYYKFLWFLPFLLLFFVHKEKQISVVPCIATAFVMIGYITLVVSELFIIIPEHIKHGHPFTL